MRKGHVGSPLLILEPSQVLRKCYSQCFPSPLVLGVTQARHFGLIMPNGGCLEMAGTPGSPLAAASGEGNDRTMQSPDLGCCDFPVALPRPGFLSKLGGVSCQSQAFFYF